MTSKTTAELLLEHFLRWQQDSGDRKTLREFAFMLGMNDKQLNHYWTGRRQPGEKLAKLFADAFHDHRFYDAAQIQRPDPKLKFIEKHWGEIPLSVQQQITDLFSPYTADSLPTDGENGIETSKP